MGRNSQGNMTHAMMAKKADPNETPLLNMAQYLAMSAALRGAYRPLLEDFFQNCHGFATGLVEFANNRDSQGFIDMCHTIKGTASMLGCAALSGCAADWENEVAEGGDLPHASAISERFHRLLNTTRQSMLEVQQENPGSTPLGSSL